MRDAFDFKSPSARSSAHLLALHRSLFLRFYMRDSREVASRTARVWRGVPPQNEQDVCDAVLVCRYRSLDLRFVRRRQYLTSNGAEQVVRHGVIMRKISYGTHSTAGSR
jgi:hypothetical protein